MNTTAGPLLIQRVITLVQNCKSTGMRIVNGRVGEDQGPFTFISRNGASVVIICYVKNVIFPISRVLM